MHLPSVIERMARNSNPPSHGRYLNHSPTSTGGIDFPEDPECFASNMHRTPEVRLDLMSSIGVGDSLGITHQTVAGVVDEDVDSVEFSNGIGNGFGN